MKITIATTSSSHLLELSQEDVNSATVEQLKERMVVETSIPVEEQRWLFAGMELENDKVLKDLPLQEGGTIQVEQKLRK